LGWASPSSGRRACLLALVFVLGGSLAAPARAKVYLSRKEALAWAFPDADRVEAEAHVLDDAQVRAVESLARAPVETRIVKLYTAWREGAVAGHALIDIHTVRTLPEAFLVVLTPEGAVRSLRVLAFHEPPEYLPAERWLEQFEGRGLADDLTVGGAIHGIAGSTLSSRAVSGAVRRSLALHRVLVAGAGPEGTDETAGDD
jgi:Na+-translocating ferredoxin:NAD+ oxidoreductase RnfG subunit